MTIKIKAPKAWAYETLAGEVSSGTAHTKTDLACIPVRIVRESDWRKLMKLVRAAEIHSCFEHDSEVYDALKALKEKGK